MSLDKKYIRDGKRQVIGSVTTGFDSDNGSVVRDTSGNIAGRTSDRYHETRDGSGKLVGTNSANAGLLIRKK